MDILVGQVVVLVVVVVLPICPEAIGIVVSDCLKVDEAVVDGHHIEKGKEKSSSKARLSKGRWNTHIETLYDYLV
jgi:hypothetical protein